MNLASPTLHQRLTSIGAGLAGLAAAAAIAAPSASAATVVTAAKPAVVAVHPSTVGYPECGETFEFNSDWVRIRSSWGTSAPIVGYGQKGQWFEGKYRTSYTYNGYYWVYGYDMDTGVHGYVALSLLTDLGPDPCTVLS